MPISFLTAAHVDTHFARSLGFFTLPSQTFGVLQLRVQLIGAGRQQAADGWQLGLVSDVDHQGGFLMRFHATWMVRGSDFGPLCGHGDKSEAQCPKWHRPGLKFREGER